MLVPHVRLFKDPQYSFTRKNTLVETPMNPPDSLDPTLTPYGPYNHDEIGNWLTTTLQQPAHLTHTPQHLLGGQRQVWTESCYFTIPQHTTVSEFTQNNHVIGIHITVDPTITGHPCNLTLSIYATGTHQNMWHTTICQQTQQQWINQGIHTTTGRGTWGTMVLGSAPHQQLLTIGVDGDRWMLRTCIYGEKITRAERNLADDITESCIIKRDLAAPGQPLDMALIDRRRAGRILHNTKDHTATMDIIHKFGLENAQLPAKK